MKNTVKYTFPVDKVAIGISGSITAVLVPPGIMWMRQTLGITNFRVIMTRQATRMTPVSSLTAIAGSKALVDWGDAEATETPHIAIAQWAEVFIVMPATANILAKVAHGITDNLLSTTLLAAECPVVFAPAMNPAMWKKPSTQRNIAQLKADGYGIVPPLRGIAIADGQEGEGGMADIPTIMHYTSLFIRQGHSNHTENTDE